MTREEAIEFAKEQLEIFGKNSTMYEFLEFSIKALEERPKGKWKLVEHGKDIDLECPFCGYKRGNLSYGYTMAEVLKDIAEDDTMLTKFCEMCGADLRGDV